MVFRRFHINLLIRVLLLSATIFLFFYLLFHTALSATPAIVGAAAVYQVYALIRHIDKTNRELARVLQSIRHADFSQSLRSGGVGGSFDELNEAFAEVIEAFRRIRAEKEAHYRYLQTVVQHVGIGLLAFRQNGDVELMNTAAKRLLKVGAHGGPPQFRNIQTLSVLSQPLVDALFGLTSGEKVLVRVRDGEDVLQLAIYGTEFRLQGQSYMLVSIQDIHNELEEKEMEAWQKLTRVLTHEIMNSVTPIASLASTVNDLLGEASQNGNAEHVYSDETVADARGALQTIEKRSQGLIHFIDAYRNFTRIPKPNFQIFSVAALFERVQRLMQAQVEARAIHFRTQIQPETLELTADPDLIEQVLINLLLNAIQSVEGRPDASIEMNAGMDERGRIIIQVIDNGPGIIEEAMDKLFVPFFTTKREGSGIGLSLSRQIMHLHRGIISARSTPDLETVFTLRF